MQHSRNSCTSRTRNSIDQLRVDLNAPLTSTNTRFQHTPYKYPVNCRRPSLALTSLRDAMSKKNRPRGPDGRFTKASDVRAPEQLMMHPPLDLNTRSAGPSSDPTSLAKEACASGDESGEETPRATKDFPFGSGLHTPTRECRGALSPTTSPPLNRNPKPGRSPTLLPSPLPTTALSLGSPSTIFTTPSITPLIIPSITSATLTSPTPRATGRAAVIQPSPFITPTSPLHTSQASTPSMPPTTSSADDLCLAHTRLRDLPYFDDDLRPIAEAEWRHQFIAATRSIADVNRAQMWADRLVYNGEAYHWFQALVRSSDTERKAAASNWSKLKALIEECWPTPEYDAAAIQNAHKQRWAESKMDVAELAAQYKDGKSKPHELWARQHRAKGKACGSSNSDLVWKTLHKAVPGWVVAFLPDKEDYGDDFDKLCKDIGNLSLVALYSTYEQQSVLNGLMQQLSLGDTPKASPPVPTPQVTPRFSRQPSNTSNPPPAKPQPARQPQVSFALPKAPPARDPPLHLPAASTPFKPLPALVAEPTPDKWARHKALVDEYTAKHGDAEPSMELRYPLSPGTRIQRP